MVYECYYLGNQVIVLNDCEYEYLYPQLTTEDNGIGGLHEHW